MRIGIPYILFLLITVCKTESSIFQPHLNKKYTGLRFLLKRDWVKNKNSNYNTNTNRKNKNKKLDQNAQNSESNERVKIFAIFMIVFIISLIIGYIFKMNFCPPKE